MPIFKTPEKGDLMLLCGDFLWHSKSFAIFLSRKTAEPGRGHPQHWWDHAKARPAWCRKVGWEKFDISWSLKNNLLIQGRGERWNESDHPRESGVGLDRLFGSWEGDRNEQVFSSTFDRWAILPKLVLCQMEKFNNAILSQLFFHYYHLPDGLNDQYWDKYQTLSLSFSKKCNCPVHPCQYVAVQWHGWSRHEFDWNWNPKSMFPMQIFEHNNDELEETRNESQSWDKIEVLF